MKKSTYVFISLLISVKFWNLAPLRTFANNDTTLVFTFIWALVAYIVFKKKPIGIALDGFRYTEYMHLILAGVLISMFSADLFWVHLLPTEVARGHKTIEGGCYW